MVNISKVIGTLAKLEGNSARITLTWKQLAKLAEAKGAPAKISEAIAGLAKKHPQLKADVGYKVSEQGFTVGAMTIRDGKTVIGTGAGSVTGLGTEEAVLKMRMQLGKNGEIFQYSGHNNLAHTPRIQDMEIATSLKNGVVETNSKIGEFGSVRSRYDMAKATEALGIKNETQLALNTGNSFLERLTTKFKDLFAGKEVDIPIGKNKINNTCAPKVKINNEYVKMPSGKNVPQKEFKEVMDAHFKVCAKLAEKNPDKANSITKKLKSLAKEVETTTGSKVQNDWIKYLGDAFFK